MWKCVMLLGVSACTLGTLAETYDFDTQEGKYAYTYPYYVVNVAGGVSNNLANCTMQRVTDAGAEAEPFSVADFRSVASGTLFKTGEGWLTIDEGLAAWTGDMHVMAGVLHVNHLDGFGPVGGANAVYAHDGATLFAENPSGVRVIDYGCRRTLAFEGEGYENMGAYHVTVDGSMENTYWPVMCYPTLTDDATWVMDNAKPMFANWRPEVKFCLNGHTLTLKAAPKRAYPTLYLNNASVDAGNIVVDGVNFQFSYDCLFRGNASNMMTIQNGGRLTFNSSIYGIGGKRPWTLKLDDANLVSFAGGDFYGWEPEDIYKNYWEGPVILNDNLKYYNNTSINGHHTCGSFLGPISGPGGITPYVGNIRYASDFSLHLANPNNSFRGGVTLGEGGRLILHANGAVPADGGMVAVTNGAVFLEGSDVYALPDMTLVGTGMVRQLSRAGGMVAHVTKLGTGDLVWNNALAVQSLTMTGGVLRLPTVQEAADWSGVAGLNVFTNGYEKSGVLREAYLNGDYLPTEVVTLKPDVATAASGWNFAGFAYATYSYRGYLWHRGTEPETWSVAMVMDKGGRFYLDGELILDQTARNYAKTANFTITPGPHAFEFRYYNTSGNSGPSNVASSNMDVFRFIDDEEFPLSEEGTRTSPTIGAEGGRWKTHFGFVFDRLGRRTHDCNDYAALSDPGDGSVFTRSTNQLDAAVHMPRFSELVFSADAGIDLGGWRVLSVSRLTGLPTIANGDWCVTETWAIPGGDVAAGAVLTTDGAFTVADTAAIAFADVNVLPRETRVIAQAAGGISIPAACNGKRLDAKGRFRLRQTSPTELSLVYSAGIVVNIR
ncbi:MAG: hypothetical protein MJ240_00855 [Kiritimatiellae bacterium]|nr:hypothetical protein [Kiritimatiellia bacterium]